MVVLTIPLTSIADEPEFESVDPNGKPNGYKPGLTSRYAIWFEGEAGEVSNQNVHC